jgi:hypothetical protein
MFFSSQLARQITQTAARGAVQVRPNHRTTGDINRAKSHHNRRHTARNLNLASFAKQTKDRFLAGLSKALIIGSVFSQSDEIFNALVHTRSVGD